MQTEQLTTTNAVFVGVPMMDEQEARGCVTRIKTRIDIARGELLELKDREGWKALGYGSWGACAKAEFGGSAATLYRQVEAAEIERSMGDSQFENLPTSQLQAVKALPVEQRVEAFKRADALAGDGPRTAKHITQAAAEITRPDLPLEFAVIKRRYEQHGHALLSNIQGHERVFVTRIAGGTGVVRTWENVLSYLERLEAEPSSSSSSSSPAGWVCDACGKRITDMKQPTNPICTQCAIQRQAARPSGAISAAAYDIQAQRDEGRMERARNFIAAGEHASARTVLAGIEVSTMARDRLLLTLAKHDARTFWTEQTERLTRFSETAMISQTTFKQALAHIQAWIEAPE